MRQISKHNVNKLTASELKAQLPFQIVSDGEVIAIVMPPHDVNKVTDTITMTAKPTELRFSKDRQAKGRLSLK